VIGAGARAMSSVVVLGDALRLRGCGGAAGVAGDAPASLAPAPALGVR